MQKSIVKIKSTNGHQIWIFKKPVMGGVQPGFWENQKELCTRGYSFIGFFKKPIKSKEEKTNGIN